MSTNQFEIRISSHSTEPAAERIGRLFDAPVAELAGLARDDGLRAAVGGGECEEGDGAQAPGERRRAIGPDVTLRLLKGREEGARRGRHQSGTAPYGYVRSYQHRAKAKKGVPLVIDAEEADVVRLIFRLYLKHRSMKRVIEILHARGLRTRRGKEWSRAGISWILKNETYLGRVHFGTIRSRGEHDAIVAPIVFYKAQKLIRKNDKRGRRSRGASVGAAAGAAG